MGRQGGKEVTWLSFPCIALFWYDTIPKALADTTITVIPSSGAQGTARQISSSCPRFVFPSMEIALIKSWLKIDEEKMGQAGPHLAGSPVRF